MDVHRRHNLLQVSAEKNSSSILIRLSHALSKWRASEAPAAFALELRIEALQRGYGESCSDHIGTNQDHEIVRPFFCIVRRSKLLLVQCPQQNVVRIARVFGKLILDEVFQ